MEIFKHIISVDTSVKFIAEDKGELIRFTNGEFGRTSCTPAHQVFITEIKYVECSVAIFQYLVDNDLLKSTAKTKTFYQRKLDQNACSNWLSNQEYWNAWRGYCEFTTTHTNRTNRFKVVRMLDLFSTNIAIVGLDKPKQKDCWLYDLKHPSEPFLYDYKTVTKWEDWIGRLNVVVASNFGIAESVSKAFIEKYSANPNILVQEGDWK